MVRIIASVVAFVICTFLGLCLKGEMTFFNVMWAIFVCGGFGVALVQYLFKDKNEGEEGKDE